MKKLLNHILNMLIPIYAVYDVLTSSSAGNLNDQRGMVYIFLFLIISVMTATIVLCHMFKFDRISSSLFIYVLFYAFEVFLIKGNLSWNSITYFALCSWWTITIIYFRDGLIRDRRMFLTYKYFVRIMFIFYFAVIFYSSYNIARNYSTVTYARVGYIYHVLSLLPLILLQEDKKTKKIFIALVLIATVFSFKRGAIIVLPITLLTYYHIENKTNYGQNKIRRFIFSIAAFIIVCYFIDHYSDGYLSRRFTRVELADGSGRFSIISSILEDISKRNISEIFFGATSSHEYITGLGAHNEWINQLNVYGVIGVIFYAIIMINLILIAFNLIKRNSILAASFTSLVVYSLVIGLVSGWLFMHSTLYIMMYLGFIMALYDEKEDVIISILNQKLGK